MQNKQQKRQAEKLQKSIQQQRRNKKSDKLSSEKRKDGNTSFFARIGKFFSRKEVPTTAQQTIPYQEIYPDGICRVDEHFFTKTLEFFDINYQLAQNEDKTLIFENYCDFLNYFDSSIRVQLSFVNQMVDVEEYQKAIDIPEQKDAFNSIRKEYVAMLKNQLAKGNNGLVKRKYILLKEEQTAAYTVEIWKRFRKWGGIPTGLTQNIKDLLASREIENIFENSDFIYMLNQANGDRQILAKQLNISPHQLSYVTNSNAGEGLIFYGNVIIPFVDHFPKDTELYRIMTTRPEDLAEQVEETR